MKRRDFLKKSTVAVSLPIFLNGLPVSAISRSALIQAFSGNTDRVLVLIQLNGGNDGLAMVLPLDQYDNLANARGNILIPDSQALMLSDAVGLHPEMSGVKSLYDNAKLTIVQGVGYPNQNRSHFRSTDIWTTGSPAEEYWSTGWLGRNFDALYPGYPDNYPNGDYPDPFAITLGALVSTTCQGVAANYSLALEDPFNLSPLTTGGEDTVPGTPYGEELTFLRQTIAQTNAYSDVITDAANGGANLAAYPADNALAQQLKTVALLIAGGLKTQVYVCSQGGYDTHANQVQDGEPTVGDHADLLRQLSEAIAVFQEDIKLLGLENRVLGMTFSEFGRRIQSNDSFGTDHGSAAPLLLFGACVNPGLVGENPQIAAQVDDQEGVALQYDFRNVYGSVLMDWFGVPEAEVKQLLFDEFQYLPVLDASCSATGVSDYSPVEAPLELEAFPNPFRHQLTVRFTTGRERARLSLFNALGGEVRVFFDKTLPEGSHEVNLSSELSSLPAGTYVLRLQLSGLRQKVRTLVKG